MRLSTLLWAVLLIALLIAIWWLGPGWEVRGVMPLAPLTNRLLATLVVVTVIAVVWGYAWHGAFGRWMKSGSKRTHASKILLCRKSSVRKPR
ncbi:hypothetical protein HORIV_58080 [Vreelandella olivaria]|uniref:Uncharacterized protein n=1 Tax=Vreelandella olivaria TaxID=390919 RepID=A0ABN5X9L5_9GAMM|nr:hypothetical protein HORIV_58080 [Halomonas olivaria]